MDSKEIPSSVGRGRVHHGCADAATSRPLETESRNPATIVRGSQNLERERFIA